MKRVTLAALSLVAVLGLTTTIAHAGAWRGTQEVYVDAVQARGVMRDARASDDGVQYITCTVRHIGSNDFPWVSCSARNAAGRTLTCSGSYEDQGLSLANLRPESTLYFQATSTGRCLEVSVTNDSRNLPGPRTYTLTGSATTIR